MRTVSKTLQSFSIIVILMMSLITMSSSTITYPGSNLLNTDPAFAQLFGNNIIQITSTSSYTDEFGNFHIIGEVNNTSTQPQTNIVVTAILSDTTTNSIVGNYSAFSSIETLRSGELSPFDIVIQNPQQIFGTFDFMEFTTTSQPASAEKPANLVLNGSSSFVDNAGNPHIVGNIINQGQSPEQLLNLVGTFYDNSSLGVVGTQSFGLNVGSLANNQMAPFDITITDNKTKSLAAFYSLNVDSAQSSMSPPLNPKFPFASLGGFVDSGLFLDSPLNINPLPATGNDFDSNNNDNNNNDGSGSNDGDSDSSSSTQDLDIEIDISRDPIVRGNIQTITVEVSDDDTNEKISNANVNGEVEYASGSTDNGGKFDMDTESNGEVTHKWRISGNAIPGTFEVTVNVNAPGYDTETGETTFEVIEKSEDTNDTSSQNNSTTDAENNNSTLTNDDQNESNGDLDCEDIDETNVPVGDDDPNNLDGDNDGVGCESGSNSNDANSPNVVSSDNNSRCPDGSHRSPSGDCERVTDTSGMPRCPDGSHRSPDGDCESVNDNNESGDDNNDSDNNDSDNNDSDNNDSDNNDSDNNDSDNNDSNRLDDNENSDNNDNDEGNNDNDENDVEESMRESGIDFSFD